MMSLSLEFGAPSSKALGDLGRNHSKFVRFEGLMVEVNSLVIYQEMSSVLCVRMLRGFHIRCA